MNISDDLLREDRLIEKFRRHFTLLKQCLANRARPLVTLTYAQSIDGCIAPRGGGTLRLSNSKSQELTHQVRGLHDAILVGINTVLCDNPRLTVRFARGDNPQPVVLDSRLRFPLDAKLLENPCERPIIATGPNACQDKADQLTAAGAQVIRTALQEDGLINLSTFLPQIKRMGFHSIMVEGGSTVITNVLKARIADQLLIAIAPRFVGGMRAIIPTDALDQLPGIHDVHWQTMEKDLVLWAQLRSPTK